MSHRSARTVENSKALTLATSCIMNRRESFLPRSCFPSIVETNPERFNVIETFRFSLRLGHYSFIENENARHGAKATDTDSAPLLFPFCSPILFIAAIEEIVVNLEERKRKEVRGVIKAQTSV